jgi:UDP-glucose 4-epimerase
MSADARARGDHVLVTGGAGFLGGHLVRRLLAEGRRVTVLDDLSTGALGNLPAHPALDVRTASVLDEQAVARAARGITAVHHLAGVVGMALATRRPAHAHAVSEEGTRLVLAATGDAPAVLYSSSAVYAFAGADGAREDATVDERDVLAYDGGAPGYAGGKLALERLGREAAADGRHVLVVRPFNVVGPGQSDAYGMVLPSFLRHALAGEPLIVHGDGRQRRAFGDVHTFVDCVLRLAGTEAAFGPDGGVVNVGAPVGTSVLELARLVLSETGSSSLLRFLAYAAVYPGRRDVRSRVPDPARLQRLIGPVHWPTVREIVRGTVARLAATRRAPEPAPASSARSAH